MNFGLDFIKLKSLISILPIIFSQSLLESYQKVSFLTYVCLVLIPRAAMTIPVTINIIWPIKDKLFPLVNA